VKIKIIFGIVTGLALMSGTAILSFSQTEESLNSEVTVSDSADVNSFSNSTDILLSNETEIGTKNTPNFYRAEVLSKEVIETYYAGDIKVTKMLETVRIIDKSTVDDLVSVHKEYFDYLESEFGDKGRAMIDEQKQYWSERIANTPDIVTIEVLKVGDNSIIIDTVTNSMSNGEGEDKDPINFFFYNNGFDDKVHNVITQNAQHNWVNAFPLPEQWVFFDETEHGGSAGWVKSSNPLEEVISSSERYHLRLFDAGQQDTHNVFVFWSLGAVHLEEVVGAGHEIKPDGWDLAETELRNDLDGQTDVGFIQNIDLDNSSCCQGISHDGIATMMEIVNPKCWVPTESDWTVTSDCTLEDSAVAPKNVLVKNNAVVTIDPSVTLNIDFANFNLTIESGSGVLIKSGGTISSP